ncbi:MAG: OsmC family protein [Pseudoxanthomonas sp.]|uniref:OsmC family protein n=1 Tax=Pseudoxanthomonas sp. TaxID=1871049 RepID=UPI0028C4504C|nr:OsmC family protein [Pseudoxanthomonas sp.]MCR6627397.1 OsmC family protein [Pseudoxanthomonas sp.]
MDTRHHIAEALRRAVAVFTRRPDKGLHDDVSARAQWQGGMQVTATHGSGVQIGTDMPAELGGGGDLPSPGWYFRAGIAACATTAIAMVAAEQDIVLDRLDVDVGSRSDARGLLGMRGADGAAIEAGPLAMQVAVYLSAAGVDAERLKSIVEEGLRRSPMQGALAGQPALTVAVSVGEARAA